MTRRRPTKEAHPPPGTPSRSPKAGAPSGATVPAGADLVAERSLGRILGRTTERAMRAALAARLHVARDVPWYEILVALDRVDPDLASMLRRFARLPLPCVAGSNKT